MDFLNIFVNIQRTNVNFLNTFVLLPKKKSGFFRYFCGNIRRTKVHFLIFLCVKIRRKKVDFLNLFSFNMKITKVIQAKKIMLNILD